MSRAVLLSIRPEWCAMIAEGRKTVEIRKTQPKLPTPFKCYIYMTKGFASYKTAGDMICHNNGGGAIIGEFICDKIYPVQVFENKAIQHWNFYDLERACVPYDDMANYIGAGKTGCGWHISNLKIYKKPLELCEFFKPCIKQAYPWCLDCERGLTAEERPAYIHERYVDVPCGGWLKRPPQSWCYVEERSAAE